MKQLFKNGMKRVVIIFFLFVSLCTYTKAQILRTANWHLGAHTSLKFSESGVLMDTSAIDSDENNSTISDTAGNLLLYTDGETVWNKDHKPISNGTGLKGSYTSSRGAVFLPFKNDSLIFLFTTGDRGNSNGLNLHKIERLKNDSFVITKKNQFVVNQVAEPIGAINHQNGRDVWVIVREYNSYNMLAYLVTESGISRCPVISKSSHYLTNATTSMLQNAIAISPDGKFLALTYRRERFELVSFNTAFGQGTSIFMDTLDYVNGVCFSPNGNLLYVNDGISGLVQHERNLEIKRWKDLGLLVAFDIQHTINGQIVIVMTDTDSLAIIEHPNKLGEKASLNSNFKKFPKIIESVGLPNFNYSYFHQPDLDFTYKGECTTNRYNFIAQSNGDNPIFNWQIQDTSSKTTWFRNGKELAFTFPDSGHYAVRCISESENKKDTVEKILFIGNAPGKDPLGKDTIYCNKGLLDVVLHVPKYARCWYWMNDERITGETYTHTGPGRFYITVTDSAFCTYHDTVTIQRDFSLKQPNIRKTRDTIYTDSLAPSYLWNLPNGKEIKNNVPYILAKDTGSYSLYLLSRLNCKSTPSTLLIIDPEPIEFGLKVYPNPFQNKLTVTIPSTDQQASFILYNSLGQRILQDQIPSHIYKLNTSDLPSGLYILELTQGNNLNQFKILKL
jgi:hypothetical protein